MGTATFSFPSPYTIPSATQANVKIWVKATGDATATNDTGNTAVVGVAFMPKKRLLFEEATGTWCGWCVRGIIFMDSLWAAHPDDVNIVSVHNGDPMKSANTSATAYDALIGNMVGGFPSMIIDRREENDPSGCFTDYANEHNYYGYANMGIKATYTGGVVDATVRVQPASDLAGDYRIELIVEEDDVTGTGSGWLQHNYYAVGGPGHSSTMKNANYDFNNLPTDIPNVKFPFVARYTLPNSLNPTSGTPNGVAGSLPATMTAGSIYTFHDNSIAINSSWTASKLRTIALLIDNNPANASYGNVLNSISTKGLYVNVEEATAGVGNMTVFPNPSSSEAHVRFELTAASNVKCSVYDVMGREVFTTPSEQMAAGGHQVNFSTENLASGAYNVIIRTENGQISQHLSVIK